MRTLLWVGNPFFHDALRPQGFDVTYLRVRPGEWHTWESLLRAYRAAEGRQPGDVPDALVVADMSLPPFVLGVEDFPCLTVCYLVDTHIHSWYSLYAQGFDLCLLSLKDHMPNFLGGRLGAEAVRWFPAYALDPPPDRRDMPARDPRWDVLFVGNVDPAINPERCTFLHDLDAACAPLGVGLHIARGDFMRLYPQGRLALNHCITLELNFRVFEAMGCGACLLTPRIGHGLTDLFTDGGELFLFDQENVPGLAAQAADLLRQPDLLEKVRNNAFAAVNRAHRAAHRGKALADILRNLSATGEAAKLIARRCNESAAIRKEYLRLVYLLHAETVGVDALRQAYLAAARGMAGR